jgi:hypothetical protein
MSRLGRLELPTRCVEGKSSRLEGSPRFFPRMAYTMRANEKGEGGNRIPVSAIYIFRQTNLIQD